MGQRRVIARVPPFRLHARKEDLKSYGHAEAQRQPRRHFLEAVLFVHRVTEHYAGLTNGSQGSERAPTLHESSLPHVMNFERRVVS